MSASEHDERLGNIVSQFETLAIQIENAIEAIAEDHSGAVNLADLHRARDAARHGAQTTRNASSNVRRAFD